MPGVVRLAGAVEFVIGAAGEADPSGIEATLVVTKIKGLCGTTEVVP